MRWRTFIWGAIVAVGCGGDDLAPSRESAYLAVNEGDAAFAAKDYAKAAERFDAAIKAGGLNPDVYCTTAVRLAVAYGATEKYDDAIALLTKLEVGAPNMDEVYAARAFVFAKQNKPAESRAALAKARQLNRTVVEFK